MNDLLLLPAGVVAGIVNAIAGGGSLISFPVFLLLGYSPFVANVSNSVGVFPSNTSAVWAYRGVLQGSRKLLLKLAAAMTIGALLGAIILLKTGEAVFETLAPLLILLGTALVLVQPIVVKRFLPSVVEGKTHLTPALVVIFAVGIYGGYFGPGIGVMLLGALGMFVHGSIQKLNAFKNFLAVCNNAVCVVLFSLFSTIAWKAAISLAIGTAIGGIVGAHVAQRLPDAVFRAVVMIVGVLAAVFVAFD